MRLQAVALVLLLASCNTPRTPLPVYGHVADFQLTAQTGQPFSSEALKGKIWVADFIFTSCTGPCSRMSSQMARVQRSTSEEIRLVSFTVDPARDTPEALAAYAKRYQAQPERWWLLTGPQPMLHQVARESFKLSNVDGSLDHSTRFVLVDRAGQIRGYYDAVESLLTDIDYLRSS